MRIVFMHPDLGIGGAERLVVDAGLALQNLGHTIVYVTSHHDPLHAFKETTDGTLKVITVGDWLPRSIFGRCMALCAYIRMIVTALYFVLFMGDFNPELIFCDQISACIPIFKLFARKSKVLFYCHFPDQLLTQRKSLIKRIYRAPLDYVEELTTGMADCVLVNSHFTESVFRSTFKRLDSVPLKVLYPTVNFSSFDRPVEGDLSNFIKLKDVATVFLSINRFERKKNLNLALEAIAALQSKMLRANVQRTVHLIVCGGYDERVVENVEHYQELYKLAVELQIEDKVTLMKSPTDSQKQHLLHSCTAVLYTPEREHFGIVPLEAMYMKRPVIAVNSGGPLETIADNETGFLCNPDPNEFADAMLKFVHDRSLAREMGISGHHRVKEKFSYQNFKNQLNTIVNKLCHPSK